MTQNVITPYAKKAILTSICTKKGITLMKHVHLASLSGVGNFYWVDLKQKDFSDGTTIFCVDNKEVKILNIKPDEVDYEQFRVKTNKGGERYSLYIRANDPGFKVEGTRVAFGNYYSGSFPVPF